ncbi:MAG: hypothetical protein COA78_07100 [Blastopirellula sp.]|nr:MAG: hypothetical protein COA78_07100 [Blastopirellula sp.]
MKKLWKRLQAYLHEAPLKIDEHWQAYWVTFNSEGRLYDDKYVVIPFDVAGDWLGQVHAVLKTNVTIHYYKIVGLTHAKGSDHIVPTHQWWLEYDHSEVIKLDGEA